VQQAFRYRGTNLGCERFATKSGAFWVCFESNLKGPVPNSYGFVVSHGWQLLVQVRKVLGRSRVRSRATASALRKPAPAKFVLKAIEAERQPGTTSAKPPLPITPPLLRGAARYGSGLLHDAPLGLFFNLVPAANGAEPRIGAFESNSSSPQVINNSFITAVGSVHDRLTKFVQGVGEQLVLDKPQPSPTPNLDKAADAIDNAFQDEIKARDLMNAGRYRAALPSLKAAESELRTALDKIKNADNAGELDIGDRVRIENRTDLAYRGDRYAVSDVAAGKGDPLRRVDVALQDKNDALEAIGQAKAHVLSGK
jgi:hypothetical protein